MVNMPAAETAAAVSSPDITLATERLARIKVTTNIRTAPRGVLIASTMDPVPFPKLDYPQHLDIDGKTISDLRLALFERPGTFRTEGASTMRITQLPDVAAL